MARAIAPAATNALIAPWRASGMASSAVVCLGPMGAGAAEFRNWVDLLPKDIGVCGIRLPGREQRIHETPIRDMGATVSAIAHAVVEESRRAAIVLVGICSGAIVMFEVARQLRSLELAGLVVVAQRAPKLVSDRAAQIPTDATVPLREMLVRLGATPPEILNNPELLALLEPAIRADLAIVDGYEYCEAPPLSIPVLAIAGERDDTVRPDALAAWSTETIGSFDHLFLPGEHLFLEDDAAARLVTSIARWIGRLPSSN